MNRGIAGMYERYLHYMQLVDCIDTLETSSTEVAELRPRSQTNNQPMDSASDEEVSDDFGSEHSDSESYRPPKKKVDLDNPYRGLKDGDNPLEAMSDSDFLNVYKFSKKTIYNVMEPIKSHLIKHTNRGSPVPPLIELLITLKYLTTGSVQKKAMNGVSQSTISRINTKVTRLIVAQHSRHIIFPDKVGAERNKIKFYERGKFPHVVGCIGSTHVGVRVKGDKDYNAEFINENGYHSVRVQLIIGPDSEIIDIVSKYPGATHENKIFSECKVNERFQSGEIQGVLLGSKIYNPTGVIMTPIEQPQHTGDYYYNEALLKTYNADECISEWKRRFRCLQNFLACKSHTQQNIIISCAILHNMAKLNQDSLPIDDEHSELTEVTGKKDHQPKKKIEIPAVENTAIIERDEFVRKNFPVYYTNSTMSYLSL